MDPSARPSADTTPEDDASEPEGEDHGSGQEPEGEPAEEPKDAATSEATDREADDEPGTDGVEEGPAADAGPAPADGAASGEEAGEPEPEPETPLDEVSPSRSGSGVRRTAPYASDAYLQRDGHNAYEQEGPNRTPLIVAAVAAVLVLAAILAFVVPSMTDAGGANPAADATGRLSVSFEAGGATAGMMSPITCDPDSLLTVPKCGYMYAGHTFLTWLDPRGNSYVPGDKIKVTDNVTLVACWDGRLCKVSFDAGGGAGSMDSKLVDAGTSYEVPACAFTKAGTAFEAWEDESGNVVEAGSSLRIVRDVKLTARWADGTGGAVISNEPLIQTPPEMTFDTVPLSWVGTYQGTSAYTEDGTITRSVSIDLDGVAEDGTVSGICNVGIDEQALDGVYGSYYVTGRIDWGTNTIMLEGVEWADYGSLDGLGSYSGVIDPATWTITGTFTDPYSGAVGEWSMGQRL